MNNFCIANHKRYHVPINTYRSLQSSTNSRANFNHAYRDNQIQKFRYRRDPATELTVMHNNLFSCFQADYFAFPVKKAFQGANVTKSLVFLAGVVLAHQQIISLLLCPYVYNNSITCRKCQQPAYLYISTPSLFCSPHEIDNLHEQPSSLFYSQHVVIQFFWLG